MPAFHLKRGMELGSIVHRAKVQSTGLIVPGLHAEARLGGHVRARFACQPVAQASCPATAVRAKGKADS
jgi:hypothetical protein